jgi:hypothetical protein
MIFLNHFLTKNTFKKIVYLSNLMSFKLGKNKNVKTHTIKTSTIKRPTIKTDAIKTDTIKNNQNNVPENHYINNKLPQECNLANVKLEYNKTNITIIPIYIDNKTVKLIVIRYECDLINFPVIINDIKEILTLRGTKNEFIITNPNFNISLKTEKHSKIPKLIVQTYESNLVTENRWLTVETIKYNNPNYEYKFFNHNDRLEFIKTHFDQSVVKAYNSLIPGTYKSDLFRYCYLYINGGIYLDCKMYVYTHFDDLLEDNDLVIVKDLKDLALYTAFICAVPKLQLFMNCINNIIKNVETKYYGKSDLCPTGPNLLYANTIISINDLKYLLLKLDKSSRNIIFMKDDEFIKLDHFISNGIKNIENKHNIDFILNINYLNYYTENSYNKSNNYYPILWNKRQIYK